MPLTLEERERRAYISNSPDHPLLCEALEGEQETRSELDDAEAALAEKDQQIDKLTDQVEEQDTEIGNLQETVVELREQIESAGLDLV